ncbi:ABC transporter [Mycobacteroides saopaulense]|uniref:ABC1 kinase family protein n=1 Tax=Mycobacteroides saopaulense TaxID=1578165 RepID=UPI000721344E|nr:AarF/ABC1/UbiB kinase family protein [Mycobacteroides saopaulense]ALR12511.1 ABC transporter [Mycobacteroides saopaulense]
MSDKHIPHGRIRRTMPLAGFTARAAGGRLVAGLRERVGDKGAINRFHEKTAERYTELLGHSKGVLMKAGQIFSIADIASHGYSQFSPYQSALTRLQADAPPMHPLLARQALEESLGRSVDELFCEFSDDPMAAASIGQVHRAILHNGQQVAVKIQYPGVAQAIKHDLSNAELMATFLRFATGIAGPKPQLDHRQMAEEVAARISEELDYRHEATNIKAFAALYADHPFIRIPEVVDEASGDRVLTMTYLDGLDWVAAQQADQDLKDVWVETIWRFSTGSFRHANLFHADPHPGNYRFGMDGSVGFVDFGCIKVVPESLRYRLVQMIRAAAEERREELRRLMVDTGYFASDSPLTADDVFQWLGATVQDIRAPQPVTFTREVSNSATRSLLNFQTLHQMSIPSDLVFLARINLNISALSATLNATMHTHALLDDLDGIAEPVSPLGKQHVGWVRDRGLPFGLDHHDHC